MSNWTYAGPGLYRNTNGWTARLASDGWYLHARGVIRGPFTLVDELFESIATVGPNEEPPRSKNKTPERPRKSTKAAPVKPDLTPEERRALLHLSGERGNLIAALASRVRFWVAKGHSVGEATRRVQIERHCRPEDARRAAKLAEAKLLRAS